MELSPYILGALKGEDMARYIQKCQKLGCVDPYNIPRHKFRDATSLHEDGLPDLDYGNIYSYLINFKAYNNTTLQAYKSLEAYKYITSGWVRDILITEGQLDTGAPINIICAKVSLICLETITCDVSEMSVSVSTTEAIILGNILQKSSYLITRDA